jgi:hypothetical protein
MVKDDLVTSVQAELGQYYMDRRKWKKAAMYFVQSKSIAKLADCLFHLGDFDMLADLQSHCADHSDVHKSLAQGYQAAGMASEAVASFLKVRACFGDLIARKVSFFHSATCNCRPTWPRRRWTAVHS